MNEDLIKKILDSDISKEAKEKILFYWLLPPKEGTVAPLQKAESRSGSVRRPSKEQLYLKKDPKRREEQEAMEETLDEVVE